MPNQLKLSRVYRFIDEQTGAPQISEFPDSNPTGDTPLEVRMKHFTEIENFTFLGYVLAHELGGTTPRPIRTVEDLEVPDEEFQRFVDEAKTAMLTDEELGDTVLDVGINWEHFVASTDSQLLPEHPLKITDVLMQEKIDSTSSRRPLSGRSTFVASKSRPGLKAEKANSDGLNTTEVVPLTLALRLVVGCTALKGAQLPRD